MRRLLISLLVATLLIAGLLIALSHSTVASTPPPPVEIELPQEAPTPSPQPPREHPPGTGFVPPPMDLSHLDRALTSLQEPSRIQTFQPLPATWDWRAQGKVTSVKDQGSCGSCYAFAAIANVESKLLVDGDAAYDLSENNAKECNYDKRFGGENSCEGGNYFELANLFSQKGVVLESCDPYVASDVACKSTCPYQKTLLDWRIVSWGQSPTNTLKQYIYNYGPVYSSMHAGVYGTDWYTELTTYDGSYTLYYTGTESTNHAVLIVGWDDNAPHDGGTGAWIAKNSWGNTWGASGYFTIAYGSANIGSNVSYMHDWQHYDNTGDIYYYDEAGWKGYSVGCSAVTAWGLAVFTPTADSGYVTRLEFWTNDISTTVDVAIYDDFDGSTKSNRLRQVTDQFFPLAGYHSVVLTAPLPLAAGDPVAAEIKFTNNSYTYPVPYDNSGPVSRDTYVSCNGNTWLRRTTYDLAVRMRTSKCFVRLNDGPIGHDLQEAIDASTSSSDVIKVAGICKGVHLRSAPSGYNGSSTVTQTAYLTKTLTIRGGYTTTNWTTSDPDANPTTLDAQGEGRVLLIAGSIAPTIEGLRLTDGDATGQGGDPATGEDTGGGVYIRAAAATISNSQVLSSAARHGGGLAIVSGASSTVENCTVRDNQVVERGGGVFIDGSTPTIRDSTVRDNRQTDTSGTYNGGAGIYVRACSPTISNTQVISNAAGQYGGGILITNSGADPELQSADVFSNTASRGGGIYIVQNASPTVNGGEVSRNQATGTDTEDGGGGLYIRSASPSVSNTQVLSNTAARRGGGVYVYDDATLNGIQVVSNTAGWYGGGLYQYQSTGQVSVVNGRFEHNTATQNNGGGLWIGGGVALSETQVIRNTADDYGGGLWGYYELDAVNCLFVANTASEGAGLYLAASSDIRTLHHLTVASATVGSGSAIYVAGGTANISNTIVASYTTGIYQTGGTLNEDYNLYFGNGTDVNSTGGTYNAGTHSIHGEDPRFVDPAASDYDIGTDSAALDRGAFLSVTTDIDGDARPTNAAQPDAPDIGCDENKATTVRRTVTDTMTFGAACARIVFTDTGSLSEITVTVVYTYPTTQASNKPLPRYYVVTPTGSGPYAASLATCYTQNEFNQSGVSDESALQLYRFTGTYWDPHASVMDTTGNVLTATQVVAFSKWAQGGPDGEPEPTAVLLEYFTATAYCNHVLVEWKTATEVGLVGFNLHRSRASAGPYDKINPTMIPVQRPGSPLGASYAYTDTTVSGGIYWYRLEIVGTQGGFSEPIQVTHYPNCMYLPLVLRQD